MARPVLQDHLWRWESAFPGRVDGSVLGSLWEMQPGWICATWFLCSNCPDLICFYYSCAQCFLP